MLDIYTRHGLVADRPVGHSRTMGKIGTLEGDGRRVYVQDGVAIALMDSRLPLLQDADLSG